MKQQVQQPAPVSRTLQGKAKTSCQASVADVLQAYKKDIAQRQEIEDDDELLQGKFETAQRDELEEDELLQGKFETAQHDELEDDELLQGKLEPAQLDELEDDELLQGKFETTQRQELEDDELLQGKFEPIQRQEAPNNTGLPDNLKAGVEQLSGLDMSDVKVHYNSSKPASVQAYAYTQGTDIHVAPGQEKHLGHEAWHVAQQKQGRVQPTTTVGGMPVNDNAGLESEADVMGGKAVQMKSKENIGRAVANAVAQKKNNVKRGFRFVDNRSSKIKPVQRLANRHGITLLQYQNRTGFTVLGWGRLTGPGGVIMNLNSVSANAVGHAEEQLIAQANLVIAALPGMYTNLEVWISSSPCSTAFGTRMGVPAGCLESLQNFAIVNGMIVNVHAQKPYQPRGLGAGMKQNSVNAANGAGPNITHDFDTRTGCAAGLAIYVAPGGLPAGGLGTVAQLFSIKQEDKDEQKEEKKKKGMLIVTYE